MDPLTDVDENSRSIDDCYFYFYSTCTKGDACQFRHCEAALGTESVCSLWKQGRCFRKLCKYRHMESDKDRSSIPCYWESQPGGCRKPHCAFWHQKYKTVLDDKDVVENVILPAMNDAGSVPSPKMTPSTSEDLLDEADGHLPSPVIEPVVVRFDEESDSEGCISTPIKNPILTDCPAELQNQSTAAKKRIIFLKKANEQDKEKEDFGFHIKSLDEIRKEKAQNANNGDQTFDKKRPDSESDIAEETEGPLASKQPAGECTKGREDCEGNSEKSLSKEEKAHPKMANRSSRTLLDKPLETSVQSSKPSLPQKVLSIKRKVTIKSTENKDLNNVQVKTLQQIREEKRLKKILESWTSNESPVSEVQLTMDPALREPIKEDVDDMANEAPSLTEKESVDRVKTAKRSAESSSPTPTKKIRLRCLKTKMLENSRGPAERRKENEVKHSNDAEGNPLEDDSNNVFQDDAKVDTSDATDLSFGRNLSPSGVLQDMEDVQCSDRQELPTGTVDVISDGKTTSSDVVAEGPASSDMHPAYTRTDAEHKVMKRMSLDEDLALLFEGEEEDALDASVELKDDDVLRELDEAINST